MMITTIVSLLALSNAGSSHAQLQALVHADGVVGEDSVLERYDLGPLLPSFDRDEGWQHSLNRGFGALHGEGMYGVTASEEGLSDVYERAAPEAITELIKQILGDELYAEGSMVSLEGESSLLVLAPAPVQARVKQPLDALSMAFSSSVNLHIDALEVNGSLDMQMPVSLAMDGADRLIQTLVSRGGKRTTYDLGLSEGRTGVIDQRVHQSMVIDYDVEIAKGSVIYDPIIYAMEEGEMFVLQAVPYLGGSSLSVVMTRNQRVGEVRSEELSMNNHMGSSEANRMNIMKGPGMMQTAQLEMRSLAATAFLPEGQALIFASQASQAGKEISRVVIIRQTNANGPGFRRVDFEGAEQSLLLVNAQQFQSNTLNFEAGHNFTGDQWWSPFITVNSAPDSSSFMFEWAQRSFSVWRRIGPWAAIVTRPDWDGQAAKDLEKLCAMVEPAGKIAALKVSFGRSAGSHTPFRWSLPIGQGSSCGLMLGTSRPIIADMDVEVASDASAKDPLVVNSFDGLSTVIGVSGSANHRFVSVRGSGHWLDRPSSRFDLGSLQGIKFDQSRVRSMQFDQQAHLKAGETLRLGSEGNSNDSQAGVYLSVKVD